MKRSAKADVQRIVSGGQTGADRAALDWAIEHNIPHGGWCPKGRKAEDGSISEHYQLQEMDTAAYLRRTEQNVIDSEGTVIFSLKPVLTGGSKRTAGFVRKHHKPLLHVHAATEDAGAALRSFVSRHQINILNVAGPRATTEPEVSGFVKRVLDDAFSCSANP